jgi:hypothetical protein
MARIDFMAKNTEEGKIMDDNSIMPFGKHKGEKMANVPAGYLLWLYNEIDEKNKTFSPHQESVWRYIKENIVIIRIEFDRERRKKKGGMENYCTE